MTINKNAIQKLEKFKIISKLDPDTANIISYYKGLSNPQLKTKLSQLLNESADDFIATAQDKPSEKTFQKDIKKGLSRFNPYYLDLDTEDRERICTYYEKLMDCVGLENSDGEINKWLYDFDPTKK